MSAPPPRRKRKERALTLHEWCCQQVPEGHPAHPRAPLTLTELSHAYSTPSGPRSNEIPAWWNELLAQVRGKHATAAGNKTTTFRNEERPCSRCRVTCLHIDTLTGDELTQRSLCECHLPPILQVRGREMRAAADALKAKLDAIDAENKRKGEERRRMLGEAQVCAGQMLRLHNRCVDGAQDFPECAVCTLKLKKVSEKRSKANRDA